MGTACLVDRQRFGLAGKSGPWLCRQCRRVCCVSVHLMMLPAASQRSERLTAALESVRPLCVQARGWQSLAQRSGGSSSGSGSGTGCGEWDGDLREGGTVDARRAGGNVPTKQAWRTLCIALEV